MPSTRYQAFHFLSIRTDTEGIFLVDKSRSLFAKHTTAHDFVGSNFKLKLNPTSFHETVFAGNDTKTLNDPNYHQLCRSLLCVCREFTIIFRTLRFACVCAALFFSHYPSSENNFRLAQVSTHLASSLAATTTAAATRTDHRLVGHEEALGTLGLAGRRNNVLTERPLS